MNLQLSCAEVVLMGCLAGHYSDLPAIWIRSMNAGTRQGKEEAVLRHFQWDLNPACDIPSGAAGPPLCYCSNCVSRDRGHKQGVLNCRKMVLLLRKSGKGGRERRRIGLEVWGSFCWIWWKKTYFQKERPWANVSLALITFKFVWNTNMGKLCLGKFYVKVRRDFLRSLSSLCEKFNAVVPHYFPLSSLCVSSQTG